MKIRPYDVNHLIFIGEGKMGLVNKSGTPLSARVDWTGGEVREIIQVTGGGVLALSSDRLYKISFPNISWETHLPGRAHHLVSETVLRGVNENNLIQTWSINTSSGAISTGTITEQVVQEQVVSLAGNAFADLTSERVVRISSSDGWAFTMEAQGDIIPESLSLKFLRNHYILAVQYQTDSAGMDVMVAKISSTGNIVWSKFADLPNSLVTDQLIGVDVTDDINVHLAFLNREIHLLYYVKISQEGETMIFTAPDIQQVFQAPVEYIHADIDGEDGKMTLVFTTAGTIIGNTETSTFNIGVVRFAVPSLVGTNTISTLDGLSISQIPDFEFAPGTSSYTLELPNATSQLGFAFSALFNQSVVVTLNGSIVQPQNIPIPIGPSRLVVTSRSQNRVSTSTYTFQISRALPQGVIYVDATSGTLNSSGSLMSPIKSFSQAIKLENITLSLKLKDFLPNAATNQNFQIVPERGVMNSAMERITEGRTFKIRNTNPNLIYAFSPLAPVRQNVINSFFIKAFDSTSEEMVRGGIFDLEFILPDFSSRAYMKFYREETNGTRTEITGLNRVITNPSAYRITLTSNSVYSIEDSGVLVPTGAAGSDPHICTLSGRKYDLPLIRRQGGEISLLKVGKYNLKAKVGGVMNGQFMQSCSLTVNGKKALEVDFRRGYKISNGDVVSEIRSNCNFENISNSNKMNDTVYIKDMWRGGVYLHINYQHRYVCPIFNSHPSSEEIKNMTGALV